ncbi:hypothetical protein LB505_010109 [Fusarium chuoi]|nr:hypothetical protein LB505_010109 [Fusarium chuoi]
MFCWDLGFGWLHRKETRQTAAHYRREMERARAERARFAAEYAGTSQDKSEPDTDTVTGLPDNQASEAQLTFYPQGDFIKHRWKQSCHHLRIITSITQLRSIITKRSKYTASRTFINITKSSNGTREARGCSTHENRARGKINSSI